MDLDLLKLAIEDSPIIAAIKDTDGLEKCLASDNRLVFVLFGNICTIGQIVAKLKAAGRVAFVHLDLISGLSSKEISVDFIKKNTQADGIISTKLSQIKRARELNLFTVQRFFVIDSMALSNIQKQHESGAPDFIEILPGVMPKIIAQLRQQISTPIIAGGLISDKDDVFSALSAGACAISTTNQLVWFA